MKHSFRDHLTVISPAIQPGLMCPENIEALETFCSLFPFDIAQDFGFESRLGKPEAVCDFFLQIRKESEGAKILAGKSPIAGLAKELLHDPLWQKISSLFAAWSNPGNILHEALEVFWFEFDRQELSYNLTPNIFFRILENSGEDRRSQWKSRVKVLDEIYNILFGIPFPKALAENLRMCIEALPENAGLYQIGFMIPRQTEAIRLVLVKILPHQLEQFLKEIQWTGEFAKVLQMINRYSPKFDYSVYNINIGNEILPDLGVEMYFNNLLQPQFNSRWYDTLDFLESDKLLTMEKKVALIRFCGKRTVNFLYPINYICGLNHLKLVHKPNSSVECKGYFGTMIRT
ncbi:MAG: hypothetical protein WCP32_12455 [Bacteroidota bacterium]